MNQEITFQGQLSPFKNCISMNADGEAEIKFTTDGTQLSNVIRVLANFPKGRLIEITLKSNINGVLTNERNKTSKTYR